MIAMPLPDEAPSRVPTGHADPPGDTNGHALTIFGLLALALLTIGAVLALLNMKDRHQPAPVRRLPSHQQIIDAQYINLVRSATVDHLHSYSDPQLVTFARHVCTAYKAGHSRTWAHHEIDQDLPHAADRTARIGFYAATDAAVLIECPHFLAWTAS